MHSSISRIKPITLFAVLYPLGLIVMLWLASDELPFLHPGKEHVYIVLGAEVTSASIGKSVLDTSGTMDNIWVEPGNHEIKFEIGGSVHTKSITVAGETYIVLDANPPYLHGAD